MVCGFADAGVGAEFLKVMTRSSDWWNEGYSILDYSCLG